MIQQYARASLWQQQQLQCLILPTQQLFPALSVACSKNGKKKEEKKSQQQWRSFGPLHLAFFFP